MTAETLLADLQGRGITVAPNGDKLRVEPSALLTDADRDAIRTFKPELMARLRTPATPAATVERCAICGEASRPGCYFRGAPAGPCQTCGRSWAEHYPKRREA